MVFADDERESNPTTFKFLQMAHAWKKTGNTALLPTLSSKAPAPSRAEDDAASDVASSHGGDD